MSPTSPLPPSPTRLRQIALVSDDLDGATHLLTHVLDTEVIYRDLAVAQWGLKNILVPLAGDMLEIASPFRPSTTASRLLSKRGPGGYMLIMQTTNATARRQHIESLNLSKVIFAHETKESVLVQYHPKGVPGSVIPELDTQHPTAEHPDPLREVFAPWHALGPMERYEEYVAGMRRCADLRLLGVVCRLEPGDRDTEGAARWWEEVFGVRRKEEREGSALRFTNAEVRFVEGREGGREGIVEILVGVVGRERLRGIWEKASGEGLTVSGRGEGDGDGDEGVRVDMLGVRWRFKLIGCRGSKL